MNYIFFLHIFLNNPSDKIVNISFICGGEFVLYKIDFLNGNQPKLDLVWIKQWQLNKTFWIHWALLCWDTASERYNEEAAGWIFYIEMEWMNMEKRQYARVSKFCNSSSSWNLKIVFSNCLFSLIFSLLRGSAYWWIEIVKGIIFCLPS